ncbi:hypothetical protein [Nitrosopumilus sp.]|uniref:hypothetical protein n=1 Tax=Nitrosopumilus sp. TaxID=2024843 RepID=UPI00292FAA87|nr:hypothetical protein [Nitrosopumilus sp.]
MTDNFCDICLDNTEVTEYDRLLVCSDCLSNIKRLEQEEDPPKLPKEQTAGGIKDEL